MQGQWLPIRKPPLEIADLAKAPLNQLDLLPASAGVYFAVDSAGRVWYIGRAGSIRERLREHNQMPKFREHGVTLVAWQPEADDTRCGALEEELIKCYHPPLNFQHNFTELPRIDFGLSPDAEVERFLRLKIQLKLIMLEVAALSPNIVTQCERAGGKISHQLGTVTYQTYESWQFSKEAQKLKQELLQRQKDEKEDGRAVVISLTTSPKAKPDPSSMFSELAIRLSPLFEADSAQGTDEGEAVEENSISSVL
jgi:hypothetical protein